MKKTNKILSAAVFSIAALSAGNAFAVTADGTLGASSTGTADVTLTIDEQFQISDMDAFAFGTFGGTGDFDATDICETLEDSGIHHNVLDCEGNRCVSVGWSDSIPARHPSAQYL